MILKTYKILSDGNFNEIDLRFNHDTKQYLSNLDSNVYDEWLKRFKKGSRDVSLSLTLKNGVFPKLKNLNSQSNEPNYKCIYFFGNINTIEEKIFRIIFDNLKSSGKYLILLQTENHKRRYNLDSTTMTFTDIKESFLKLYKILKKDVIPEIYVLSLNDYIGFNPEIIHIANNRHLELKKGNNF
jgi:hypothetical protein